VAPSAADQRADLQAEPGRVSQRGTLSDPFEATVALRDRLHEVAMREVTMWGGAPKGFPAPGQGFRIQGAFVPGNPAPVLQPAVFTGGERLTSVAFRRDRALPAAPDAPLPPLPPMRRVSPNQPYSGPPAAALDLEQLRNVYSRALADRDPQRADVEVPPLLPLDGRDASQTFLSWLIDRAGEQIEVGERILTSIGLDHNRLLGSKDDGESVADRGVGGPFVPFVVDAKENSDRSAGRGEGALDLAALDVSIERWSDLRRTLRQLPLGHPVNQTEIGSGFGRRVDPMNGRTAFHEGIDFRGSRGSDIYATGSGVVTFAGRRGRYGRTVEIDHGNGVTSIYAHLDRIKVEKGDIVTRRMVVGPMGASGRATGVHLHYEVRVDGRPRDPNRFVTAGRYVQSL
jgi:murein DD-endopeptidase MepM/ murein hydrolase activator NlpD